MWMEGANGNAQSNVSNVRGGDGVGGVRGGRCP